MYYNIRKAKAAYSWFVTFGGTGEGNKTSFFPTGNCNREAGSHLCRKNKNGALFLDHLSPPLTLHPVCLFSYYSLAKPKVY